MPQMTVRRRCLDRYVYCLAGLCSLLLLFFALFDKDFGEHFDFSTKMQQPANTEPTYLLKPAPEYCRLLNFLVMVHVRYNDEGSRDFWRATYGNAQFLRKYRYRLLFAVGLSSTVKDRDEVLHKIEDEQQWHGDILLGDYDDTYKNISLKQLSHLQYFSEHCSPPTILLKIDDDIGWRLDKAAELVRNVQMNSTDDTATIHCLLWSGMLIQRDPSNKWYVPENVVSGRTYPEYCSGIAYLATWYAVDLLIHSSKEIPYFWVDDVYITGTLATRANVTRKDIKQHYRMPYDGGSALELGSTIFQMGPRWRRAEMFHRSLNGIQQAQQAPFPYYSSLLETIYPTAGKKQLYYTM